MNVRQFQVVFALIVAASIAAGCKSSGGSSKDQKSAGAVTGLQQTKADLVKGRQQVNEAVVAANALQKAPSDVRPAYNQLDKEINDVEAEAKRIKAKNEDMNKRAKAYQEQWQKEVSAMQNPTLRMAATQRAAGVKERYQGIEKLAGEARQAYDPFIGDLKDLRTYLSNDMTPGAVKAAAPIIEKINANGKELEARINALIKELDDTAASISPTGAAPAKK